LRVAPPTRIVPKLAQSTWACSPGSVESRKNASWRDFGRSRATKRRKG
jgi:hypothetical protein